MALVQWHSRQPRDVPVVDPPPEEIILSVSYSAAPQALRNRIDEFAAFAEGRKLPISLEEVARRMGLSELPWGLTPWQAFVRVATLSELEEASWGWKWSRFPKTPIPNNCLGFSGRYWIQPHALMSSEPKDPSHNWGIMPGTDRYACCGLPRDHPGCWKGSERYKLVLYDVAPSFSSGFAWTFVRDRDWAALRLLWIEEEPRLGTLWIEESKFLALHEQMQSLKPTLADQIVRSMGLIWDFLQNDPDVPLDPFLYTDLTEVKALLRLQERFNEPQCPPPYDLFAIPQAREILRDVYYTIYPSTPLPLSWEEEARYGDAAMERLASDFPELWAGILAYNEYAKEMQGLSERANDLSEEWKQLPQFEPLRRKLFTPYDKTFREEVNQWFASGIDDKVPLGLVPDIRKTKARLEVFETFKPEGRSISDYGPYEGLKKVIGLNHPLENFARTQFLLNEDLKARNLLIAEDEEGLLELSQKLESDAAQERKRLTEKLLSVNAVTQTYADENIIVETLSKMDTFQDFAEQAAIFWDALPAQPEPEEEFFDLPPLPAPAQPERGEEEFFDLPPPLEEPSAEEMELTQRAEFLLTEAAQVSHALNDSLYKEIEDYVRSVQSWIQPIDERREWLRAIEDTLLPNIKARFREEELFMTRIDAFAEAKDPDLQKQLYDLKRRIAEEGLTSDIHKEFRQIVKSQNRRIWYFRDFTRLRSAPIEGIRESFLAQAWEEQRQIKEDKLFAGPEFVRVRHEVVEIPDEAFLSFLEAIEGQDEDTVERLSSRVRVPEAPYDRLIRFLENEDYERADDAYFALSDSQRASVAELFEFFGFSLGDPKNLPDVLDALNQLNRGKSVEKILRKFDNMPLRRLLRFMDRNTLLDSTDPDTPQETLDKAREELVEAIKKLGLFMDLAGALNTVSKDRQGFIDFFSYIRLLALGDADKANDLLVTLAKKTQTRAGSYLQFLQILSKNPSDEIALLRLNTIDPAADFPQEFVRALQIYGVLGTAGRIFVAGSKEGYEYFAYIAEAAGRRETQTYNGYLPLLMSTIFEEGKKKPILEKSREIYEALPSNLKTPDVKRALELTDGFNRKSYLFPVFQRYLWNLYLDKPEEAADLIRSVASTWRFWTPDEFSILQGFLERMNVYGEKDAADIFAFLRRYEKDLSPDQRQRYESVLGVLDYRGVDRWAIVDRKERDISSVEAWRPYARKRLPVYRIPNETIWIRFETEKLRTLVAFFRDLGQRKQEESEKAYRLLVETYGDPQKANALLFSSEGEEGINWLQRLWRGVKRFASPDVEDDEETEDEEGGDIFDAEPYIMGDVWRQEFRRLRDVFLQFGLVGIENTERYLTLFEKNPQFVSAMIQMSKIYPLLNELQKRYILEATRCIPLYVEGVWITHFQRIVDPIDIESLKAPWKLYLKLNKKGNKFVYPSGLLKTLARGIGHFFNLLLSIASEGGLQAGPTDRLLAELSNCPLHFDEEILAKRKVMVIDALLNASGFSNIPSDLLIDDEISWDVEGIVTKYERVSPEFHSYLSPDMLKGIGLLTEQGNAIKGLTTDPLVYKHHGYTFVGQKDAFGHMIAYPTEAQRKLAKRWTSLEGLLDVLLSGEVVSDRQCRALGAKITKDWI